MSEIPWVENTVRAAVDLKKFAAPAATVESRSFYLPLAGQWLSFVSIEGPTYGDSALEDRDRMDAFVSRVGEIVTGVPMREAITLKRWVEIHEAVKEVLLGRSKLVATFRRETQMAHRLGDEDLEALATVMDVLRSKLIESPGAFSSWLLAACVEEGVPPVRLLPDSFMWKVIHGIMRDFGFSIDFRSLNNWVSLTSCVASFEMSGSDMNYAYRELQEFEIPFAGSKPIKSLTVGAFLAATRGCAYVQMAAGAWASANDIAAGRFVAAFIVSGVSVGTALVFVTFGALLPRFQESLASGLGTAIARENLQLKDEKGSDEKD